MKPAKLDVWHFLAHAIAACVVICGWGLFQIVKLASGLKSWK